MNVLVFGTGGVGGIYAYILQQGGANVTVVCRSNYAAVQANGIEIDSAIFGKVHARPRAVVRSVTDLQQETESSSSAFDYIVVTAKAFPGLSKLVAPAVAPSTAIVLAQNGIGIEQEYADAFPTNVIISGVVYLPTTQITPGKIRMGNLQRLHIGSYPAATATTQAKQAVATFAETFTRGGGAIFTHDDVQQQRWVKLSVNVAWNPMCALARCDDANLLRSSPDAEAAVRGVMAEVAAVAAASGYPIAQAVIEEQLERPKRRLESGGKEPSMLTDVREGRALEVDAILGNAVAAARRVGVETPRLDLIYALARALSYSIKPDERWKAIA